MIFTYQFNDDIFLLPELRRTCGKLLNVTKLTCNDDIISVHYDETRRDRKLRTFNVSQIERYSID